MRTSPREPFLSGDKIRMEKRPRERKLFSRKEGIGIQGAEQQFRGGKSPPRSQESVHFEMRWRDRCHRIQKSEEI